ncbi:MAG TPA: nicotinate-nucleotide--dimethylbenzimidazole phosphoribosyltransferase [Atribacterota bacterium]|nr:nicotinate-nucleotide--dimethylbenzimidazole phosphoribosyltransferase [Atribacterota bacterium]
MNNRFEEIIGEIPSIDNTILKDTLNHFDKLAKPRKSLGKLEEIVARAAAIYGTANPAIDRKVIFLMAADHGVTNEQVSAYSSEITYQMVLNFLKGGAAINVLARHFGVDIVVTDIGVNGDLSDKNGIIHKKIAFGTNNMALEPAMSREMAERSIEIGFEVFEESFARRPIDLIGLGEMGIGNTTASSAIISLLTGAKVEDVVDCGAGLPQDTVQRKIEVIKKAISLNQPDPYDAISILAKVGGFEIGGLVGCIFAAAKRRVPIVMDGLISGACALLALRLNPVIEDYLFTSHCSREKGHKISLDHLGMFPIFDLKMFLGEGTGAIFGINFIEAGFKLLNEMTAFDNLRNNK